MFEPHAERKVWAKQQVEAAEIPEGTAQALLSVYHTWLNMMPTEPDDAPQALQVFNDLVNGHAIEYHKPGDTPEVWTAIRLGNVRRGDYVRVKRGAYSGEAGECHNGRRGPVVRVTNGDVVVKYDDGLAPDFGIMGTHHPPYNLEKRTQ